jgi:hypothetical protein
VSLHLPDADFGDSTCVADYTLAWKQALEPLKRLPNYADSKIRLELLNNLETEYLGFMICTDIVTPYPKNN